MCNKSKSRYMNDVYLLMQKHKPFIYHSPSQHISLIASNLSVANRVNKNKLEHKKKCSNNNRIHGRRFSASGGVFVSPHVYICARSLQCVLTYRRR